MSKIKRPALLRLGRESLRNKSATARQRRGNVRAADLAAIVKELRAAGATSPKDIAAELNARGIRSSRGIGKWSAVQVARLLARI